MTHENELSRRFQETIAQHKGILLKVARTYCFQPDERQDLIQEMMLQIWRTFPRYNTQYKITTWLYRIALNVAISHYRKGSNLVLGSMPLDESRVVTSEHFAERREEQLQLLERFIQELSQLDKALMLLYLEEKSHAEIAEILGLSESNVSTKVGRIKEKLKKRFSQHNSF